MHPVSRLVSPAMLVFVAACAAPPAPTLDESPAAYRPQEPELPSEDLSAFAGEEVWAEGAVALRPDDSLDLGTERDADARSPAAHETRTWRRRWCAWFACSAWYTVRYHPARDARLQDEVLLAFDGTMQTYSGRNNVADAFDAWAGRAYYVDGPDLAGVLAGPLVEFAMELVRGEACEADRFITYAGYSRGALQATSAQWMARNACADARVRAELLIDPVGTLAGGLSAQGNGPTLVQRKTAAVDRQNVIFKNTPIRCQAREFCDLTDVPLDLEHTSFGRDPGVAARLRWFGDPLVASARGVAAFAF